ncbi:DNA topoisomerase IV subunit A [Facklamia miroungae]|uniref:DNA topoisomerase 4 subunit A n=1 Tax=Facklamia miroungae TaxID=120956 RepID=A0A1G7PA75_9LACT|nr:DNA topoisomerase IV subunit A [Facklamia miroungae]NKZ28617.1 DNA topoisomerase IV subunit A [Facklamia miroungae]SDF82499.1 topoisomerase-4 subunit A [Facklamia miroungae]
MTELENKGVQELNFSSVIGDRFGRYSKYIIQDRALPDIRDGLKPVQRRILYAMFSEGNTSEKAYRKSAKTVGNVIGNYHPHGDSSVYEAMVRMSQSWKNRQPLIDMHGNNGSMDGDPAAAMRYTEARLSSIAMELLRDIHSETVDWILNFDDTIEEPRVLPARFPNLLVNGATGISAGYATDIPPHNLGEVIDSLIFMLDHPSDITVDALMKYLPGPDFPTGGIIQGREGIREAYQTGQGKVVIRSKLQVEKLKGGKSQIVVTEVPYDVNKGKLIQKLDEIRLSKKLEGIADVRDDSDINGVSLVIELKRDVEVEPILAYLYKNTDLQVNYHFNMIAIHNRRPVLCSLEKMLQAYLDHQKEIIRRRTQYLLKKDQDRLHIVDGLIRVMSILDEVIATIRQSENKADAKTNLHDQYEFSMEQAEAIVSLQLYRLTNTDIVGLQQEKLELNERIYMYQNILSNDSTLDKVLGNELKAVKKKYNSPRMSQLEDDVEEITLEKTLLIPQEQVYVSVTKEGYLKRTSVRSFTASDAIDLGSRDLDYPLFVQELSTHDAIVIVTSKGNYIHLPVYELPDIRWKVLGLHWSQQYQLLKDEAIIAVFAQKAADNQSDDRIVMMTKAGRIKQTFLSEFSSYRSYKTRTMTAIKLQDDKDCLVAAKLAKAGKSYQIACITHRSYGLRFDIEQVSIQGLKAQGIVGMKVKADDYLVSMLLIAQEASRPQLFLLTNRANVKRMDIEELASANRASVGTLILKEIKTNPHRVVKALALQKGNIPIIIQGDTGKTIEMMAFDVNITKRQNNGSQITDLEQLGKVMDIHPSRLKMLDDE